MFLASFVLGAGCVCMRFVWILRSVRVEDVRSGLTGQR